LLIPRFYVNPDITFNFTKEKITLGSDIEIEANKDFYLRDDKIEILEIIKNKENGIIQLPTGFGKTVLAIKLITELKKKCLIIVDREILLDQWKSSILKVSNLKEEDIGIYQSDKTELDKPVVISMVQTLVSKLKTNPSKIISDFYEANFGITFVDEVHSVIGPEIFSDVRLLFFSKRLYALSATPFRNISKETKIINYCFGDIIVSKVNTVIPTVYFKFFENSLPSKSYYYISKFGNGFNYTKYSNAIFKNQEFINMILDEILNRYLNTKYKILIPLITIKSIDQMITEINKNDKYTILKNEYYKLTSSTKDNYKQNKRLIFSTIGLVSKGFDDTDIDTLILPIPMGSSKVFLTQLTGRIMRKKDGKNDLVIIDFVDTKFKQTEKAYQLRRSVYEELNFNFA
ncbi:MAG: DEAD/DEAH box helicase, partial [Nanopusillaceae archaeon]